jgi:hypothetical protein
MTQQQDFGFPSTRASVLRTAEKYVTQDRAETHGDADSTFSAIAEYWSTHLSCRVTATDVSIMMALLKLARLKSSPRLADNWIDGCGYLAVGAEIATRRRGG